MKKIENVVAAFFATLVVFVATGLTVSADQPPAMPETVVSEHLAGSPAGPMDIPALALMQSHRKAALQSTGGAGDFQIEVVPVKGRADTSGGFQDNVLTLLRQGQATVDNGVDTATRLIYFEPSNNVTHATRPGGGTVTYWAVTIRSSAKTFFASDLSLVLDSSDPNHLFATNFVLTGGSFGPGAVGIKPDGTEVRSGSFQGVPLAAFFFCGFYKAAVNSGEDYMEWYNLSVTGTWVLRDSMTGLKVAAGDRTLLQRPKAGARWPTPTLGVITPAIKVDGRTVITLRVQATPWVPTEVWGFDSIGMPRTLAATIPGDSDGVTTTSIPATGGSRLYVVRAAP